MLIVLSLKKCCRKLLGCLKCAFVEFNTADYKQRLNTFAHVFQCFEDAAFVFVYAVKIRR